MSNDFICRTKELNATHPCFIDDRGECIVVTIEECGLDLEGIPANEQTRELFEAARMTGLSTILSVADVMEVARKNVGETDSNRLKQEANRFYENAKVLIQKMKSHQPEKQRSVDPRPCSEISLFDGCGDPDEAPICKRCSGAK